MAQQRKYLQFCKTPDRRSPFVWPHEQDDENSTLPQKGAQLNTIEKFHIHTEFAKNSCLYDPQTILSNAIFDTLIKDRPTQQLPNTPTPIPDCRHS